MMDMICMQKFEQLSPSDFFFRNRSIAGFTDERAIYQSVRESVENALDSADVAQVLPFIRIKLLPIYPEKNLFNLTVSDNGCGIPASKVPDAFGTVLYGSKYRIRQSRGAFGLGIKMAVLFSQITTNRPIRILTSTGTNVAHDFVLKMDLVNNKPIIMKRNTVPNPKFVHGTLITLTLRGKWTNSMASKLESYLNLSSISNPSATIEYINPEKQLIRYERSTTKISKMPEEGKPHPKGVDIEALKRMAAETKGNKTIFEFLTNHFDHVGETIAKDFLNSNRINPGLVISRMRDNDFEALYVALKNYDKFMAPSSKTLSPIGEMEFERAVKKHFNPQFVKAVSRTPQAYSGNPFIVECCIAYGDVFSSYGKGLQVFRFANKIPLLFDLQGDLFWTIVKKINWQNYRINPKEDPVALFCHLCSTKISYKTAGKEMLAQIEEIYKEGRRAMFKVANALSSFISQQSKVQYHKKRLGIFERYLPEIARNVSVISVVKKEELLSDMWKVVRGESA